MEKLFVYLLIVCNIILFVSCEDTDYQLYDESAKNKLFFAKDSLSFTYGLTMDKDIDLEVEVNLIGFVNLSQDEYFKIEIVGDKTTAILGKHFTMPEEHVIMKDSLKALIPLNFYKQNLDKNKDYYLTLRLSENEHYMPTDTKECVILFKNEDIESPIWWKLDKLGNYNQEKLILFVDFFHKAEEKSPALYEKIESEWGKNLDQGTSPHMLTQYQYLGFFNRYILTLMYEYYLVTNNPMYQIPNPNN